MIALKERSGQERASPSKTGAVKMPDMLIVVGISPS